DFIVTHNVRHLRVAERFGIGVVTPGEFQGDNGNQAMNRTISLPDDLLKKAEELASFERLSLEEFLSARLSEQFAGLDYLKKRAERASDEKFRNALRYVPDVEPDEHD